MMASGGVDAARDTRRNGGDEQRNLLVGECARVYCGVSVRRSGRARVGHKAEADDARDLREVLRHAPPRLNLLSVEEELRLAIDYVDGVSSTVPVYSGKNQTRSDEITKAVAAARNIACSGLTAQNKIAIPAYSTEKEEAYKFVLFYASDKAQEILLKYGILSSFGYTSANSGKNKTEFVNSMMEIVDNPDTKLLIMGLRYPMSYKAGLDYTGHSMFTSVTRGFEKLIYDGVDAATIYNEDISYYTREWSKMLVKAGYGRQ